MLTREQASELLNKVTQRTLALDNHFSHEHLCFVMTMTDDEFSSANDDADVKDYIDQHAKIGRSLRQDLGDENRLKKEVEKGRLKHRNHENNLEALATQLKELDSQIKSFKSRLSTLESARVTDDMRKIRVC